MEAQPEARVSGDPQELDPAELQTAEPPGKQDTVKTGGPDPVDRVVGHTAQRRDLGLTVAQQRDQRASALDQNVGRDAVPVYSAASVPTSRNWAI